ncbi:unnamed protein product, partial [marine sediment metagenome]
VGKIDGRLVFDGATAYGVTRYQIISVDDPPLNDSEATALLARLEKLTSA